MRIFSIAVVLFWVISRSAYGFNVTDSISLSSLFPAVSNVQLDFSFEPSSTSYVCLPETFYPSPTGQCFLAEAYSVRNNNLRIQLPVNESQFFTLPEPLRVSMIAMSFLKAYSNYQKLQCKSHSCCSSNNTNYEELMKIKRIFIAVYLAMGVAHILEEGFIYLADTLTDYGQSLFHAAMLTISVAAWQIDCDCAHPLLNKHVAMMMMSTWTLANPFHWFH